ncbi:uncharacterized protein LOC116350893 isoform X2 [Contarinia nasturtii]|uniref:uncharacterized protein LOC116350893 isoform X2 n=1 Tax=Contarinia nasturtii TaxID=265458 RepID=UPI0012D49D08|nr:uncharacterized protein LOC116350893 isoform X2 [Contarinia nasturtii]
MNEVKCKHECDKPNDETFLLLSTSLNSISSSPFATQTSILSCEQSNVNNQYTTATPPSPTSNASDSRNNRPTCITNTMPLSKSTIVHTCCYKHHCQLSACHINNGEYQASTSKKLLLSVPLQRKFIGAIGIDARNNCKILDLLTSSDQRLVIAHYSCVEKFTKMYTPNTMLKDNNNGRQKMNKTSADQLITAKTDGKEDDFSCSSDIVCDNNLTESLKNQRFISTSPLSDEGLAIASPYCSSGEEEDVKTPVHEKVERSSSSDSAIHLDDEILARMADLSPRNQQRRMTLTVTDIPLRPALLPVAEPTSLPDSPLPPQQPFDFIPSSTNLAPLVVPSKMILEARIVEIPTPTPTSPAQLNDNKTSSYFGQISRRESCVSEDDMSHVRIVRTPSVVVSDYSEDVLCGITLEELEFFRQQRKSSLGAALDSPRSSATEATDYLSDLSAASSCSNLNYCGSSISLLDDNYSQSPTETPERKFSSCSTCSIGQEDNEEESSQFSNNLIDALNQQQQQRKTKVCTDSKYI